MKVSIRKLSDKRHEVTVVRNDGSTATIERDSKDFLRHDLAHFAVEVEVGLEGGYWGSVASASEVLDVLEAVVPEIADSDLANRLRERMRALTGQWAATEYGHEMILAWPFS